LDAESEGFLRDTPPAEPEISELNTTRKTGGKYLSPASRAPLPVNGQLTTQRRFFCFSGFIFSSSLRSTLKAKAFYEIPLRQSRRFPNSIKNRPVHFCAQSGD
ncbi:MAG: hypothetical protein RSF90_05955, partial [Pygmaiobacter sp.]